MTFIQAAKLFSKEYSLELIDFNGYSVNFIGARTGHEFFTPRSGVEDDNSPGFDDMLVERIFKTNGYNVNAYDHEKGLFTIDLVGARYSKDVKK